MRFVLDNIFLKGAKEANSNYRKYTTYVVMGLFWRVGMTLSALPVK